MSMQACDPASPTPPEGRILARAEGEIFFIGLDRPAKLNGFSPRMLTELAEAFDAFERHAETRCAVLHAVGPHFTAGLELDKVAAHLADGNRLWPDACVDPFSLRPPLRSKPVVCAVQGICFTIGIELMLAADIVIAADNCRFAQLEVGRGIMASGGATIRMVERAGWGHAMRYLLTGEEFDAATALRLGFVQEVVPAGTEFGRAAAVAGQIAAQAPLAVSATLLNARRAMTEGIAAAAGEFAEVQRRLMRTQDAAEGVRSFLERRPARFTGR